MELHLFSAREFARKAIEHQKDEFQSWAVMADWLSQDRLYFTFSKEFIIKQLHLFLDFYEKGLIYRDLKPVFWSPSSKYLES